MGRQAYEIVNHEGIGSPALWRAVVRSGRCGDGDDRAGRQDLIKVEVEIAELSERSTHDLRLDWRRLHRTDPPLGLSRDLLIRALANQLQERTHGRASRALRRRLHNLTAGSRKVGVPVDPDFRRPATKVVLQDAPIAS